MGGYLPYVDFTEFALALGIVLSALVSLIGTSARRRTVALGEARLSDLAELTGILESKRLMAVFGPPDMGRTWPGVTLLEVRRARTPMGWLMSSDLVDYACIAGAVAALVFSHKLVPLGMFGALAIQVAGWVVSTRVPK
ncbi:MAG: hypothetical protein FP825_09160 [Hyphomonas sp.]|uniref:hypothetical protein n=1 Tax=Hyphomonas sp. TaxID=87 RepID=UPI0017A991A3|nr:hypothetical protein [Hyphomonas sp.]MBU3921775.1 hypothetical protein [Alphaproteobacteria bacterium]MBA3068637.1 hypothetical protein [Hyphomonas sp.]MBU4061956.1 hypothetical protein [Alphaproteobacteria bacterium]MBU4166111.1 hypothetical protein [Alphaproteobacteria bacterium]MBU4567691.1 hypothetical protein [Alphaproteobacteria bacterium]